MKNILWSRKNLIITMFKLIIITAIIFAVSVEGIRSSSSDEKVSAVKSPIKSGEYLGQKKPGTEPELFAPGIISTGLYERDIAITPDGKEIYYGLAFSTYTTIMVTKNENGYWTEPEVASFAKDLRYFYFEPALSYDGKKIFFLSSRPKIGQEDSAGWAHQNIWVADRKPDGTWSDPYDIGSPINSDDNEYYPSITRDGTLYFTRSKKEQVFNPVLYRSRLINGKYSEPERLPEPVNGKAKPYNTFISPDESYLITCINGLEDAVTPQFADYYIFFHTKDDKWIGPINPGKEINAPQDNATSAYVTRDGKFLFFASSRTDLNQALSGADLTLSRILLFNSQPGNGRSDIYWIDSSIIRELRPKEME